MRVARRIVIAVVLSFSLIGGQVWGQDYPTGSVGHSPSLSGTSYRDSVYRRILREGGKSIDCRLSYRIGSSTVLPSYEENADELGRLDDFLRVTLSDTLVQIKDISLTGYGSIDGTYIRNEELSRARSEGFALYLRRRYPRLSSYAVRTSHVAEDWAGLAELVSSSSLEEKERILSIINKVGVFDGRERQLMELSGGAVYRELERTYFPLLRRVQVRVEYDLQKVMEEHYQVKISQQDFAAVLEREKQRLGIPVTGTDTLHGSKTVQTHLSESAARTYAALRLAEEKQAQALKEKQEAQLKREQEQQEQQRQEEEQLKQAQALEQKRQQEEQFRQAQALQEKQARKALEEQKKQLLREQEAQRKQASALAFASFQPFIAVKTNLLSLAGYSAELKKRYLTPNVELEYFAAPHWSVSGEWVYGVTDVQGGDAHVWAPSSLSLEPRYWFLDSTNRHHWLYLGLYVLSGEYDDLLSTAQKDGHTGSYYEGGLSVGCYVPLSLHLGLEFGARVGYRSVDGSRYSYKDSHYYYENSYTESGLKATGFRVSVSYRFGRTYSPRK